LGRCLIRIECFQLVDLQLVGMLETAFPLTNCNIMNETSQLLMPAEEMLCNLQLTTSPVYRLKLMVDRDVVDSHPEKDKMETQVRTPHAVFMQPQRPVVPLFQSPYVWDKENQWEPLWKDMAGMTASTCKRPGLQRGLGRVAPRTVSATLTCPARSRKVK
jgi:hypothetical protein